MDSVDQIAQGIMRREGGYVNDPDDPGGATNHGVTIHTMRRLGLDLTGDGQVDAQDVRALTKSQAVQIFIDHYFIKPGIGELPKVLHASVFDMYVNAGNQAIKILQRLLAQFDHPVSVDGGLGPQTINAVAKVAEMAPNFIADAYGIERRNYYYRLADRRISSRKYARRRDGGKGGWITRAEEFISPKYHLSLQDHKARCAKWA